MGREHLPLISPDGAGLVRLEGSEGAAQLYELAIRQEEGAGLWVRGADLTGEGLEGLTLSRCLLEGCRFTGAGLRRLSLTDCILSRCDLSGAQSYDGGFHRCRWQENKALGCNLSGLHARDWSCTDCRLDAIRLDGASLEGVRFAGCNLAGANLGGLRWKQLELTQVNLSGASVTGTALKGLDLRSCRLEGLAAGDSLRELRGAIVDPIQAAELARLLGLDIR